VHAPGRTLSDLSRPYKIATPSIRAGWSRAEPHTGESSRSNCRPGWGCWGGEPTGRPNAAWLVAPDVSVDPPGLPAALHTQTAPSGGCSPRCNKWRRQKRSSQPASETRAGSGLQFAAQLEPARNSPHTGERVTADRKAVHIAQISGGLRLLKPDVRRGGAISAEAATSGSLSVVLFDSIPSLHGQGDIFTMCSYAASEPSSRWRPDAVDAWWAW